jgi:hypothetical protein
MSASQHKPFMENLETQHSVGAPKLFKAYLTEARATGEQSAHLSGRPSVLGSESASFRVRDHQAWAAQPLHLRKQRQSAEKFRVGQIELLAAQRQIPEVGCCAE